MWPPEAGYLTWTLYFLFFNNNYFLINTCSVLLKLHVVSHASAVADKGETQYAYTAISRPFHQPMHHSTMKCAGVGDQGYKPDDWIPANAQTHVEHCWGSTAEMQEVLLV